MAKKKAQKQEVDYLSQISLDIKEEDFSDNPALVKKFLAELKDEKADNLALRDSLESTQDTLESLTKTYNELDKDYAIVKSKSDTKLGVSIIQDVSAAGFGGGLGVLFAGQIVIGLSITIPTFLLYIGCRVITAKS